MKPNVQVGSKPYHT